MILSVSRRTDIPALYSDWFMNRLRVGEVMVRNPLNPKQVSSIPLNSQLIDCLVFWTKDPRNLMPYLDEIDKMNYKYYFTITITPYGDKIEKNLDNKEVLLEAFESLSHRIGKEKLIWRYDPIIFSDELDERFHINCFENMVKEMSPYTNKCVISFLDSYKKIEKNLHSHHIDIPKKDKMFSLLSKLSEIAQEHSLKLATCSQELDLKDLKIEHNKCIDNELIEQIVGGKIMVNKDKSQRETCLCVESRDIGSYNTCTHGCIYCYANRNKKITKSKVALYDPLSPILCDQLDGNETISYYKRAKSLRI